MKKGHVTAILCLLLVLGVLCGLIYFDLFRDKEESKSEPVDMALFENAVQEIADSRTIGGHLWIMTKDDAPTLFRYTNTPTFSAKILKENKAALLYTTLETNIVSYSGHYELYYDDGWKVERLDGNPIFYVEETTYNFDNMDGVTATFGVIDEDVRPTAEQLEAIKSHIEQRLSSYNIFDYTAEIDAAKGQVIVSFLWADALHPADEMMTALTKTGMLQFYEGDSTTTDANGFTVPKGTLVLDGNDVKSAVAAVNQDPATSTTSPYVIALDLNEVGTAKFSAATKKLAGKGKISIWLDFGEAWAETNIQPRYVLLSSPTVETPISDGKAVITGFTTYEDAKEVADMIASGALPFDITLRNLEILRNK